MEMQIYTLHSRGRPNEVRAVGDGKRPLGVIPPLWAIWNGLWLSLVVMLVLLVAAGLVNPWALRLVWGGLLLIVLFEGGAIERLELRLRGWREVGVAEARTEEGAEELFLKGEAR